MRLPHSARLWAYVGALLGGGVSIAANVRHSYVPPAGAGADWSPDGFAVGLSVFWPVALFVAIEVLARTPWPSGWRWLVLRFGGLLPVAAVAAIVSYQHLAGLLRVFGEDAMSAAIGPLAVDGLMVMASGALIATGRRTTTDAEAVPEVVAEQADTPPAVASPVPADDGTGGESVTPTADTDDASDAATDSPRVAASAGRAQRSRRVSSAERVARAAARLPGASVAQIAAKANVSESTARRHLPRPVTPPTAAPSVQTPADVKSPDELLEVAA